MKKQTNKQTKLENPCYINNNGKRSVVALLIFFKTKIDFKNML
jgi:hypothetical protein